MSKSRQLADMVNTDAAGQRNYWGSVANEAAMLALSSAERGDWCKRADLAGAAYELTALPPSTLGNWVESGGGGTPADATTSTKGIVQLTGGLAGTATAPTALGYANTAALQAVIDGINAAINAKQASSSKLSQFSGVGSSAGAVENIDANSVAIRSFGISASTSIPTRADVDTRFPRVSDGLPGGGVGLDSDWVVLTDKPQRGTMALKVSGAWAKQDKTYTWAARPSAVTYSGEVITISDFNQDFWSNGTNWIPIGKELRFGSTTATANHTGTTTETTLATHTIPAGLVLPGCSIGAGMLWTFTGAADIKTPRAKVAGSSIFNQPTVNTDTIVRVQPVMDVAESGTTHTILALGTNDDGHDFGTTAATLTADFSASVDVTFTMQLVNAADGAILKRRVVVIEYL